MHIKYGKKAKLLFFDGVGVAADTVAPTIGPYGSYYLIGSNPIVMTKNGYKIINEIKCDNPVSQLGISFITERANRLYNKYNNGTTSFILIASSMMKGVQEYLNSGMDSVRLANAFNNYGNNLRNNLLNNSRPFTINDSVSMNNYNLLLRFPFITNEYFDYEIINGDNLEAIELHELIVNNGALSNSMLNNSINGDMVIEKPVFTIINQRYELAKLIEAGSNIFIFNNITNEEINNIIRHQHNCPQFVAINANDNDILKIRENLPMERVNGNYVFTADTAIVSNERLIIRANHLPARFIFTVNQNHYEEELNSEIIATRLSLQGGVNRGMGLAYIEALNGEPTNAYEEAANRVLQTSLAIPYQRILDNANIDPVEKNLAYDFNLNKYIPTMELEIFEPTILVIAVLEEALRTVNDYIFLKGFIA
jgi:hypothetical protein